MNPGFLHWPNNGFDLADAYVPLPGAAVDDFLNGDDQPVSAQTRTWASALMARQIASRCRQASACSRSTWD